MVPTEGKKAEDAVNDPVPEPGKIDRTAPAGSETSLGAQSVRDGRPVTDDSVVEAIDDECPSITAFTPDKKGAGGR